MIVEAISRGIARAIKNSNPEDTASVEVLEYGLKIVVNAFLIILITLIVSSWLSSWINGLIALFSFALLRFFSGGIHINSSDKCVAASVLILVLISTVKIQDDVVSILNIATIVLVLLFAPNNIHVRYKKIHIKDWMLKLVAATIVLANMVFIGSEVASFAFIVQGLTIINLDWVKGRLVK